MEIKQVSILFGIVASLLLLVFATTRPSVLETRRLADHCGALYGFNTPESIACIYVDDHPLSLASKASGR